MSYNKTTWVNGVTNITADVMNNLEDGVVAVESEIASKGADITNIKGTINQNTTLVYSGGVLTTVKEYWANGSTLKTNVALGYTNNVLTTVTTTHYLSSGVKEATVTETLIYSSGILTSVQRSVV